MMAGRIWVESEPSKGSTFHFQVRLGLIPSKVAVAAKPLPEGPLSNPILRGKKILVAEDNPVNQVMLELILQKRDHRLTFVSSSQEITAACERERFDLILMDLQLSQQDRLAEFIQRIETPICALSATGSEEENRQWLLAGFVGVLRKPVQPAELFAVIDEVLAGK
jgi:CheY-like chemotaxis protein